MRRPKTSEKKYPQFDSNTMLQSLVKETTINLLVNPALQCPEARFLYEEKCNLDYLAQTVEADTQKVRRRLPRLYKSPMTTKQHYHLVFTPYDGGSENKRAGIYVMFLDSVGTVRGVPLDSPEFYIRCNGIDHIQAQTLHLYDKMNNMEGADGNEYCACINWAIHAVTEIYSAVCVWNVLKVIDRKKTASRQRAI